MEEIKKKLIKDVSDNKYIYPIATTKDMIEYIGQNLLKVLLILTTWTDIDTNSDDIFINLMTKSKFAVNKSLHEGLECFRELNKHKIEIYLYKLMSIYNDTKISIKYYEYIRNFIHIKKEFNDAVILKILNQANDYMVKFSFNILKRINYDLPFELNLFSFEIKLIYNQTNKIDKVNK